MLFCETSQTIIYLLTHLIWDNFVSHRVLTRRQSITCDKGSFFMLIRVMLIEPAAMLKHIKILF